MLGGRVGERGDPACVPVPSYEDVSNTLTHRPRARLREAYEDIAHADDTANGPVLIGEIGTSRA